MGVEVWIKSILAERCDPVASKVGAKIFSPQSVKSSPLMEPSTTQGALIRSLRNAAGRGRFAPCLRGPQPRSRDVFFTILSNVWPAPLAKVVVSVKLPTLRRCLSRAAALAPSQCLTRLLVERLPVVTTEARQMRKSVP